MAITSSDQVPGTPRPNFFSLQTGGPLASGYVPLGSVLDSKSASGPKSKGSGVIPGAPQDGSGGLWAGNSSVANSAARAAADAQAKADAAANAAKAAARSQSSKENANTQRVIDTLFGTLKGYRSGRDQALKNAQAVLRASITGLDRQYTQTVDDLESSTDRNEADEAAKTFANRSNRARESRALLEQLVSQGAGETDQLRGMVQAFTNADANQLDVTSAYYDTLNNINSSLRQANSSTENARRNAWGQAEDARAQAYTDFANNYTQVWTDIQRTAASNSNIDSEYSEGFKADFHGKDPYKEAASQAGYTYEWKPPKEDWAQGWKGKETKLGQDTSTQSMGATTLLGGLRRAEGATLRRVED